MSRYFSYNAYTDTTEDIVWRDMKHPTSKVWLVYLGEHCVGQVWMGRRGCTAVVTGTDNEDLLGPRLMEGFRTRWDATAYILQVGGYQRDRDNLGQTRSRMEYNVLQIEKNIADSRVERLEREVESLRQAAMRQQAEDFPLAFTVDEGSKLDTVQTPSGAEVKLRRLTFPETQRIVKMFRADDVAALSEYIVTNALRPY